MSRQDLKLFILGLVGTLLIGSGAWILVDVLQAPTSRRRQVRSWSPRRKSRPRRRRQPIQPQGRRGNDRQCAGNRTLLRSAETRSAYRLRSGGRRACYPSLRRVGRFSGLRSVPGGQNLAPVAWRSCRQSRRQDARSRLRVATGGAQSAERGQFPTLCRLFIRRRERGLPQVLCREPARSSATSQLPGLDAILDGKERISRARRRRNPTSRCSRLRCAKTAWGLRKSARCWTARR